jgi:predicted TIM-barrel fold metal-dependent hydrolase
MDRAGIQRAIVCSVATRPGQVRKITDWSAATASERLIPFASIHPDFEHPESETERVASLGLKGLKFHPLYMDCPADDPRTVRIAHAAARAGLAMVFHAGFDVAYEKDDRASPRRLRAVHDAVPELRLVASHLGGWRCWEEVLECLAGQPVYLETSWVNGHCPADLLARILARHSPDYLLFGTDAPWRDQASELAWFRGLALPEDDKRRALWDNGHRFAGLATASPWRAGVKPQPKMDNHVRS